MYRPGHLGAALLCGVPGLIFLSVFGNLGELVVWVCCLVGTSSLPDIDQRLPIPHRGPTHSFVFIIPASLVLGAVVTATVWIFSDWEMTGLLINAKEIFGDSPLFVGGAAITACFVGLVSHLLADALTVGRGRFAVQPFWPVSDRNLRLGVTKADSLVWNYGLLCLGSGATIVVLVTLT